MEIMGKPNKDFYETMRHMCDAVQKRVDEAYKKGVNDGSLDVKIRTEGAYQKGFNDGKEYGLDEADMREAVSYQKGLSDAWEAAKKIVLSVDEGGLSVQDLSKIFESEGSHYVLRKYSASEAINKIKEYEEKKDRDVCRGCIWEGRYDGDCAMCSNNYRELYTPKKIDKEE